ncbi:MAG: hypothetical protein KAR83_01250 [Thermodesulfovibrionales bacterium]|nr:hypothetical protein [Thermodesulfovibrionales bacterium]
MDNSTEDSFGLSAQIKAALIRDVPVCALALLLVLSFKWTDKFLTGMGAPGWLGPVHVLGFLAALSWLIFRQLYRFRQAVREMLITRILNREFWLARWLVERYTFLGIVALFVSIATAASLMVYIYISGPWGLWLFAADALVFVLMYRHVHFSFTRRVFQEDIARLISEFAPVLTNVLILFAGFIVIAIFVDTDVFALGDVRIPERVIEQIDHSWRPFRYIARTAYFLELNVRSLKSLEHGGTLLYIAMYLTTVSVVPYTALSLVFKSSLGVIDSIRDAKKEK